MMAHGRTARATTGRGCLSNTSEALSRMLLGTPPGWTLCGITGLLVLLHPRLAILAVSIDFCVREKKHCHNAMMRSIERSLKEAQHARRDLHLQEQP